MDRGVHAQGLAADSCCRQKRNVRSQDEESGAHRNLLIGSNGLTAGDYQLAIPAE